jgi:hypothetical protein
MMATASPTPATRDKPSDGLRGFIRNLQSAIYNLQSVRRPSIARQTISTRDELIDALAVAAELEHALCCLYLYAGFSLKRRPDAHCTPAQAELTRDWTTTVFLVARQEMGHLGMVCNMLAAIGGAPYFLRPAFPLPAEEYPLRLPLELLPFGEQALQRFICFERPEGVDEPDCDAVSSFGLPIRLQFDSVQQLYDEITDGFEHLVAVHGESTLFIGPGAAQIGNEQINFPTTGAYNVDLQRVTDLKSARSAIAQIVEEGEGAPEPTPTSHYARFKAILATVQEEQARDPNFEPARRLAPNPVTIARNSLISNTTMLGGIGLAAAQIFNRAYEAMLLMLIRFYADTDESPADVAALQAVAFFPMMTMVIRPLGEILSELPAADDRPDLFAGPTFEFDRNVGLLPHRGPALTVIGELLTQIAAETADLSDTAARRQLPQAARLAFVQANLARIAVNFKNTLPLP